MALKLLPSMLLSAKILLPASLSDTERLSILKPFFAPPPGQPLTLDPQEEAGRQHLKTPAALRGYITVTPPKGQCLTITRSIEEPDQRVCRSTSLKFTLGELQEDGSLTWHVKGEGDTGATPIRWPSSYRIGRYVDTKMPWPGPSQRLFIKKCEGITSSSLGRRVYVHLLHGDIWTMALPATDIPAPQPLPLPNLYVLELRPSSNAKQETSQPEEQKEAEEAASKDPKAQDQKTRPRTKVPADANAAAAIYSPPEEDVSQASHIVSKWQMHPRGAFLANASAFTTGVNHPPGMQGECRYKYAEKEGDPTSGRLECFDADRFKWLSLPLPCLNQLAPKR